MALGLVLTVAACSSGSTSPTVASLGTAPTTTARAAAATASSSGGDTPLAQGLAYSRCMRDHKVPTFPDPVATPDGGYGYRMQLGPNQIDPKDPTFVAAGKACQSLAPEWWVGKKLTPAEEQAWLVWAKCIRANGLPSFPDPTFTDGRVSIDDGGSGPSRQMQVALQACKARMPSNGGIGG